MMTPVREERRVETPVRAGRTVWVVLMRWRKGSRLSAGHGR
jgi:hypothetical protein